MKKQTFMKLFLAAFSLFAGLLLFTSCGEDPPVPVASYDYVADNFEVTFTNTSTNATSYLWEFGDEDTSTEESPVHTYSAFGTYTVTLEVTSEGGTDKTTPEDIVVEKNSVVVIDGDHTEWAGITAAVSYTDGEGGFLTELKIDYDATYLYFYLKGTDEFRGFIDVYLNTDNDAATGAQSWVYPDGLGAELLVEGDIAIDDGLDLFQDNPDSDDWCWDPGGNCGAPTPIVAAGSGLVKSGLILTTGSVKEVEFSIMRSLLPDLSSEKFGIGVCDYSKVDDGDWGYYGSLPQIGTENSKLYIYEF